MLTTDLRVDLCVSAANGGGESDRRCRLIPVRPDPAQRPEAPADNPNVEVPPYPLGPGSACSSWVHKHVYQGENSAGTSFLDDRERPGTRARADFWISRDCPDSRLHVAGKIIDVKGDDGKPAGIGFDLTRGWQHAGPLGGIDRKKTAKAEGGHGTAKEFHFDFPSGGDLQFDVNDDESGSPL